MGMIFTVLRGNAKTCSVADFADRVADYQAAGYAPLTFVRFVSFVVKEKN
jgi:hypothetical protein